MLLAAEAEEAGMVSTIRVARNIPINLFISTPNFDVLGKRVAKMTAKVGN